MVGGNVNDDDLQTVTLMVETLTPELEIRGPVILIGPPAPPRKLGIAAQSELTFRTIRTTRYTVQMVQTMLRG